MKLVKISMELAFYDMEDSIDFSNKDSIADFLNNVLYSEPEFFGNFGPENIESIRDVE